MEQFFSQFLQEGEELVSIVLLAVLVGLTLIQIVYYLRAYGPIRSHRNPEKSSEAQAAGLSVIIPLREADYGFVNERLPLFLNQTLKEYQVVVVDLTGDKEMADHLDTLKVQWGERLTTTRMRSDKSLHILTKIALNVGIKAARYDQLLFTLPDCMPRSERWAEMMTNGFAGKDVVLGYASIHPTKGLANRLMRCANMALSARWLSSAVRHRPYRGVLCNLGFRKSLYFEARGFNYLNINMGEDDLFVMKIAKRENTSVVMGASATIDLHAWGGLGWWFSRRLRLSFPFRYYPARVKWGTGFELWTRVLFFASVATVGVMLPLAGGLVATVCLALRYVLVWWQMKCVARRLSERGSLALYWVYDLFAPIAEAVLAIRRRLMPMYKWR